MGGLWFGIHVRASAAFVTGIFNRPIGLRFSRQTTLRVLSAFPSLTLVPVRPGLIVHEATAHQGNSQTSQIGA
jgi:hypothetical protein